MCTSPCTLSEWSPQRRDMEVTKKDLTGVSRAGITWRHTRTASQQCSCTSEWRHSSSGFLLIHSPSWHDPSHPTSTTLETPLCLESFLNSELSRWQANFQRMGWVNIQEWDRQHTNQVTAKQQEPKHEVTFSRSRWIPLISKSNINSSATRL